METGDGIRNSTLSPLAELGACVVDSPGDDSIAWPVLEPEPPWLCVPDTGLKIWWARLLRVMRPGDPELTTEVLVSGLSICHGFSSEMQPVVVAGGYVLARLAILFHLLSFSDGSSDELIVGKQTSPVLDNVQIHCSLALVNLSIFKHW